MLRPAPLPKSTSILSCGIKVPMSQDEDFHSTCRAKAEKVKSPGETTHKRLIHVDVKMTDSKSFPEP